MCADSPEREGRAVVWKWNSRKGGISIKQYLVLWGGSIALCYLVLTATWYVARARLRQMKQQMLADAKAVDAGRLLEIALLSERREDMFWSISHDESHRKQRDADLRNAREIAEGLPAHVSTPQEQQIVDRIVRNTRTFQEQSLLPSPPPLAELRRMADDLLRDVNSYLDQNREQMEATISAAWRLHASMDYWAFGVGAFVAVILCAGTWGLVNRIARPMLDLRRAAIKFGGGDFSARAPILREDELGEICRTFNNMADEVADHEKNRLQFVAGVVHDLKNPLVTIGGAARILKNQALPPPQQTEWLTRIISQVMRLENLVLDLMDTVQVETGQLRLMAADMDLTALLRDIQREQKELVTSHSIVFEGNDECRVRGDKNRLERVVLNLISNAVKYSPEGTMVHLRVEKRQANAVCIVQDHGAGMSPEDLKVAFQPFGRVRRTQSMAKGTGMGLCVVKQIVEAHGGTIHVASEVGVGTTVEVSLPLALG